MPRRLTEQMLLSLSDLLAERIGIYFPKERWEDLERALTPAMKEIGLTDAWGLVENLAASTLAGKELETLASYLTVGETYFFRDPHYFDAIEGHILNDLIRKRRGKDQYLRIWSAGCATGEEPYSIAILLHKLLQDIRQWNITILATDINPRFLQKAEAGVFSEWSFRGVPEWIKAKYFKSPTRGFFELAPEIKKMVTFTHHNLAEGGYPALLNGTNAMDIILCRNVLMYFKPTKARQVVDNLRQCLVEGGWLAVSSAETSHTLFSSYQPVFFHDFTFYRNTAPLNPTMSYSPRDTSKACIEWADSLNAGGTSAIIPLPGLETIHRSPADPARPQTEIHIDEADPYEEAQKLYQSGRHSQAAARINQLLTDQPDHVPALELMARVLANQGRLDEAHNWCSKAIYHDRLNASCHHLFAMILQERGLINEAIASLKRTLYLDPSMALAHFSLGNLVRIQDGAAEATKHFRNALTLLKNHRPDEVLPESDGMTVVRLRQIIENISLQAGAA